MSEKIFIIAEAGVNHNGDLAIARKLVDAAAESGADAVKFQAFKAAAGISHYACKAEYQRRTTGSDGSQLEMVRQLEFDKNDHLELLSYCKEKGIAFLSSPFDMGSLKMLNDIKMDVIKIPSGEIVNAPLLRMTAKTAKRVILSSGMAEMEEIRAALSILTGEGFPAENITILHCTTEYPAPLEEVNLKAMNSIADEFGLPVGYSDHTAGIEVSVAAAAIGASIIEKHLTLDNSMEGPDHKASLQPEEFKNMVDAIRKIEKALGDGKKTATPSEKKNRDIVRKSIVAARAIKEGELLTEDDITVKRPGNGISPMLWDEVIGRKAIRDFEEDEILEI
ncbi:MAG: N-acetylneuraminate synthase [Candidatus Omnitrophica bacterium]|nr:N-acetylneuraminate synthase [Candidatus Omnitrophota bacterium]MBU1128595.1 N-acetylneuraminate synthase [Candidatus Omnitrophota bacterium]MBU1784722.1 N-acetylneuraminate synthase [Candidatus Omnitrophota bacterium]MBU1851555.1 N-acetylneuraminate synthase [Candidatus Omnitrophota bacterium]